MVCCRSHYSSVVVSLNNSASSQPHLAGGGQSTRPNTFVSSRVSGGAGPSVISTHVTLPGYVINNSDPSIPEEPEDSRPKRVDNISLKEIMPPLSLGATAENEEETMQ